MEMKWNFWVIKVWSLSWKHLSDVLYYISSLQLVIDSLNVCTANNDMNATETSHRCWVPLKSCDCESMSLWQSLRLSNHGWVLSSGLKYFISRKRDDNSELLCTDLQWSFASEGELPQDLNLFLIWFRSHNLMKICFHYCFLSITNPNVLFYFLTHFEITTSSLILPYSPGCT